jgi:amidase
VAAAPDWSVVRDASGLPMSVPGAAMLVAPSDDENVEPRNRAMLAGLRQLTVLEHARAVERARAASIEFGHFWDDVDVLVTPVFGIAPPPATWARWDFPADEHSRVLGSIANFAQPFNVTGQPALSLPLAWTPDGLPLGIQIAGRFLDESRLLALAAELERAQPWADRRPPLVA